MPLLKYDDQLVLERLLQAHNPNVSPIRDDYMKKQYEFFHKNINNKYVLVAGSGLGKEVATLAKYNRFVVGIDNNPLLVKMSKAYFHGSNMLFKQKDFMNSFFFLNEKHDVSFLNWGTIGNFNELEQIKIINNLVGVSKECTYMDFYTPDNNQNRIEMYTQEGWKNVRVKGNAIVSDDGGHSQIFTPKKFEKLVHSTNDSFKINAYYPIEGFGYMAKIVRK